jgi:hypothetical protein
MMHGTRHGTVLSGGGGKRGQRIHQQTGDNAIPDASRRHSAATASPDLMTVRQPSRPATTLIIVSKKTIRVLPSMVLITNKMSLAFWVGGQSFRTIQQSTHTSSLPKPLTRNRKLTSLADTFILLL